MDTRVLVSHAGDGELWVLSLSGEGQLTALQQLPVGIAAMPMATHPDRRTLHVALRREPFEVVSLAIDPADGRLRLKGRAPLPASMAHLQVDRGGRWLLSASYPGHLMAVSPIDADGIAGPPQQLIGELPNAHCVRLSPDQRHVHVVSLGADEVRSHAFDARTGRIDPEPAGRFRLPAGSGPRHLEWHPRLPIAYLSDELDGQLHVLAVDGARLTALQHIDSLPPTRPSPIWSAEIRMTPDGRHVYVSERTGSTVTGFRADPASGLLTLIGHWPTEATPRAMAIDPRGRFLLVAGQTSNRIGVHAIEPDGGLTAICTCPVGETPSWIEVIDLADG